MYSPTGTKLSFQLFQERKLDINEMNRQQLVEAFLEKLNPPRIEAGFRPLTPARFNSLPAIMDMTKNGLFDLKGFYKECDGGNFSKTFWYRIKVRT